MRIEKPKNTFDKLLQNELSVTNYRYLNIALGISPTKKNRIISDPAICPVELLGTFSELTKKTKTELVKDFGLSAKTLLHSDLPLIEAEPKNPNPPQPII